MVCQLHIMVRVQYNLIAIKYLLRLATPRRTELVDAVIRISVRRSAWVNVEFIIDESPIRRHLHTLMYFRVSDKILLNFDI